MEQDKSKIAIMIMAAGASSRMGRTKQLLPWGTTTLIGNAIKNAKASDACEVFVVLGAYADVIKKSIGLKEKDLIYNKDWESGLGSSIAHATKAILTQSEDYDGVLVMLADQPLIDASYLNQMITEFYYSDFSIIATKYKQGNGVPAIFGASHFLELQQLNSEHGAKDIIRLNKNKLLSLDPKGKTADVDTYEEYLRMGGKSI